MMTYAIFGFTLVSLPFIALFILMWRVSGLGMALKVWGIVILVVSTLAFGIHLLVLAGILKP